MKARRITLFAVLILGAVSVFCFIGPAAATTYTWDPGQTGNGSDGSGNWDLVTTDWALSGSTLAWVNGYDALFGVGISTAGTVTIAGGSAVTPNSITFNPALSGNYTISGGSINLSNASTAITVNANATISSALSGTGGLAKMGTKTLLLTGTNSYTGLTTVSAGVLQPALAASLPLSGSVSVATGATLTVPAGDGLSTGWNATQLGNLMNSASWATGATLGIDTTNAVGGNFTYGGNLSGAMGLSKLGSNMLTLTGNINLTAPCVFSSGSGTVLYNSSFVSGGTIQINGNATFSGNITGGATGYSLSGNTATTGGGNNVASYVYNGTTYYTVGGLGSTLIIAGGTTTLSGSDSYAGLTFTSGGGGNNHCIITPTIINAGAVLSFSSAANIPQDPSAVRYQDNWPLQVNGTLLYTGTGTTDSTYLATSFSGTGTVDILNPGANFTFSWPMSSGSTIYKTGSGMMTIACNEGGVNAYVQQGTLLLATNGGQAVSSVYSVSPGATLELGANASSAEIFNGISSMNGTFNLNGYSTGLTGLTGSGTITNGALSPTSTLTFGFVNNGGSGGNTSFAGSIIDGTGKMALAVAYSTATLTLTGTGNTYSGGTTISAGELQIGDGSTGPGSLPGNVLVSNTAAGALTFNTPAAMSVTSTANISGAGGLTKTGSGLALLSGSNSFTGSTAVSKGVLESAGTVSLPGWNVPNAISVAGGAVLAVQTNGGATTAAWNSSQIGTLLTSASWASNTAGLGIDTTNGDFTYGGNITQALTLTKLGSNALALSGNNTYTGGTTLAAGQLNINSPTALGSGPFSTSGGTLGNSSRSDITVNSTGMQAYWNGDFTYAGSGHNLNLGTAAVTLGGNRQVTVTANTLTVGGSISGNYSLTKLGNGALTLSGVNSTYTGGTTVSSGTLSAGGTALGTGTVSVAPGAILAVNANTGLTGFYYQNVTALGNGTPAWFSTLSALQTQMAPLAPSPIAQSNSNGGNTFSLNANNLWPSLSNTNDFESLYTGGITITTPGAYSFGLTSDDGAMIWIDGKTVVNGVPDNGNGSTTVPYRTGGVTLSAGVHQIAIGFYQQGGGYGLEAFYDGPDSSNAMVQIPNAVLTPDLTVASLSGSGNLQLATANLVTGSDNSNQTYSGVISGWGGVTKMGSGTWTLTNTNTYCGNTLVTQGTLQLGSNLAMQNSAFDTTSPGALVLLPGVTTPTFGGLTGANNLTLPLAVTALTLNPQSGVTQSYSGNLGGGTNMALIMAGAGVQILSGANTYSGSTSVTNGVLEAATTASLPGYPSYSGSNTLTVAAGATLAVQLGNGTTGWNSTQVGYLRSGVVWSSTAALLGIDTTSGNATYSAALAMPAGLNKLGANTLTLTGSNTYSGPTTVTAGALSVASTASLPGWSTSGSVTVAGGAILAVQPGDGVTGWSNSQITGLVGSVTWSNSTAALGFDTSNGSFTYSGNITQQIALGKVGANTLTLTGTNSYTGGTTLNAGTLNINADAALGATNGPLTFTGSSTLQAGAAIDLNSARGITISSGVAATLGTQGYGMEIDGVITGPGSLTKAGSGTLTLTAANTYVGGTTLSGGLLNVAALNDTPSSNLLADSQLTLGGGTLQYTGTGDTASLSVGFNSVGNGGLQVSDPAANLTLLGQVQGGTFNKSGSGTLTFSGGVDDPSLTFKVLQGTVVMGRTNGQHCADQAYVSAGATLQFGNSGSYQQLDYGVDAMNGTLDFNGQNEGFGVLNGTGTITNNLSNSTSLLLFGYYYGSSGGSTGANGGSDTFAGNIVNGAGGSGVMSLAVSGGLNYNSVFQASHLTLTGTGNTYTGNTTISAGTLQIGDGSSSPGSLPGNVVIGSLTYTTTNGTFTAPGALVFNTPAAMGITASGNISGSSTSGLTKTGSGILNLTGSNTYSGGTTITLGTLEAATTAALPTSNPVGVAAGATLAVETSGGATAGWNATQIAGLLTNSNVTWANNTAALGIDTSNGNFTYGGTVNEALGLTKLGGNTLTLTAANNSYTGKTTIAAGQLQIGDGSTSAGSLPGSVVISSSTAGALTFNTPLAMSITAGGNISGSGAGGLTKTGSGLLTLIGNNSYSGGTTISGGTLQLTSNNGLGSTSGSLTVNSGGVLDINGYSPTVGALNGSGTIDIVTAGGNPTLLIGSGGASGTFSGVIQNTTGALVLTKTGAGTEVLSGSNTYAGTTSINGGVLNVQNANALGGTSGGYVLVSNSAALQLQGGIAVPVLGGGAYLYLTGQGGANNGALESVSGSNSWAGPIALWTNSGATRINSDAGSALTLTGGIIDFSGPGRLAVGGSGNVTISGVDAIDSSVTSLTKDGSGSLILSGSDYYTGGTDVEGGTLYATNSNAIPAGTGLTVDAGGTVVFVDPPGAGTTIFATASPAGRVAAVPEPGTLALLAVGALAAGLGVWQKRKGI